MSADGVVYTSATSASLADDITDADFHLHISLNPEGGWGTTDDLTCSVLQTLNGNIHSRISATFKRQC